MGYRRLCAPSALMTAILAAVLALLVPTAARAVEYNDDFANGINPEHWTVVTNEPLFTCDDSGGDVFISKPEGGSGYRYYKLFFDPHLLANFDVSVDFSEVQLAPVGGVGGSYAGVEIGFGDQFFVIGRNGTADNGDVASVWVDPPGEWIPVAETATAGTFRLTRIGSLVTGSFDNTVIYSGEFNDEPVNHLCLVLGTDTSDAISTRFDDFSLVAEGYSPARQVGKIGPPDVTGAKSFGEILAISGNTLVVADRRADGVCRLREAWNDRCGAVWVFERVDDVDDWTQVARFAPAEDAFIRFFGSSIAIDGDTIAVGNQNSSGGGVFIYQQNRGGTANWGEVARLDAVAPYEHFGDSVALSGDTLLVGAPDYGSGYLQTEGVRVFERNRGGPDNWGEVTVILPSHGRNNDQFGSAVAISGDTAVVGSPFHDHGDCPEGTEYCSYGTVFVFERDHGGPDNWGESAEIIVDYRDPNQGFGSSLAIEGDTVVVGTESSWWPATEGGMYIFEREQNGSNTWRQVAEVWRSGAFGTVEDLKRGQAMISDSKSSVIFERSETGSDAWVERFKFSPREGWDSGIGWRGGAIGDGYYVVGAPNGDVNCPGDNPDCNSGAVYLFVVDSAPTPTVRIRRPSGRRRP